MASLLGALIIAGAIPYTHVLKGHIRIGLLVESLPPRIRYIIEIVINLIGFTLFALISWQATLFAITTFEIGELSEVLKIPLTPFAYIVAIGCIAITLVLLLDVIKTFSKAVWK